MTVSGQKRGHLARAGLVLAPMFFASCARAPSFDILGSFFPAWLVCLTLAVLLTALVRWLLLRLRIAVAFPILVYPSLTALFTFALWLVFFH
jgi:YtcA family